MQGDIVTVKHIVNSDANNFAEKVMSVIVELQRKGLSVDIQYQTTVLTDEVPGVVFSAFITGRKYRGNGNVLL